MPDVRAVAAMPAELDIVLVAGGADPEHPDELVLAAVETPLASVRLDPHGEIDHGAVNWPGRFDQLLHMPPVDADVMDRYICENSAAFLRLALRKEQNPSTDISPLAMASSGCFVRPRPTTLLIGTLYGGSRKAMWARSPAVSFASSAALRASPAGAVRG